MFEHLDDPAPPAATSRTLGAVLARAAWGNIPDDGGRGLSVLLIPCEDLIPPGDIDTPDLARQMLDAGLRAVLNCVDPEQLSERFVGREFDEALLAELPTGVDPCGGSIHR